LYDPSIQIQEISGAFLMTPSAVLCLYSNYLTWPIRTTLTLTACIGYLTYMLPSATTNTYMYFILSYKIIYLNAW